MLRIAVEVAGIVCGAGCSIFSQTVDRLLPLTADRSLASHTSLLNAVLHICQKYYFTLFDWYSCVLCTYKLFSAIQFLRLYYRRCSY